MPVNNINRTMQMSALPFSVNPLVDFMTMMYAGDRLSPRPQPGTTQGLYDAYFLRQQTMQMRAVQQQALATSMPLARLGGINTQSPVFQMMAGFASDPNGPLANFISPWIGGNPMKAQMGYMANLNTQAMTTFGRTGAITLPETSRMMHELNRFAYNHKALGKADLRQNQADILRMAGNQSQLMRSQVDSMFGNDGFINKGAYDTFRTGYSKAADLNNRLADASPNQVEAITKAMVNAFTDSKTKEALKTAFADGSKTGKQLSEEAEKVLQIKEMNNLLGGTLASHITDQENLGVMRPTGINYKNTMGLNLEDFSSAFTTLATAKLFGKGTTNADFLGSRPADMIDAAKGMFGNNLSGGEAMQELSNLLGVSSVNLGDAGDSSKLTASLRNFKALGRNADIAVEALIGLVHDANRVASQTEGLRYLGGKENIKLVDEVVRRATGMAGAASNDYVRRQGGMPGLVANQMEATFSAMSQPISRQVAALSYQYQGNAGAQALINQFLNTEGVHNAGGFSQLVHGLSRQTGVATTALTQASMNSTAQNLGMRMNPEGFRKLGESAVADRFLRDVNRVGWLSGAGRNYGDRLINALSKNGQIDPDALLANPLISQSPQLLQFVEANKNMLATGLMHRSENGRATLRRLAEATASDRQMEEYVNQNYGHLNAPAGQAMLNELFKMGPDGRFSDFFKPLVDAQGLGDIREIAINSSAINGATTLQQVAQRSKFYKLDGKYDADLTARRQTELGSYADTNNTVSKLARAAGLSESELLEKMGSFHTEIKGADGVMISPEKQRDQFIDGLASNITGMTPTQRDAFKRMDHAGKAKMLRDMGLAGVNMSDLAAVKGGLEAGHRRIVSNKIVQPGLQRIDKDFNKVASETKVKGYNALLETANTHGKTAMSNALNVNDLLNGNFDATTQAGKEMMSARNQFIKENIGEKRAGEDDAAYFARAMANPEFKQFAARTSKFANDAGGIRDIGARAAGGATDSLPVSMKKLTDLVDKMPAVIEKLTAAIQEATKT